MRRDAVGKGALKPPLTRTALETAHFRLKLIIIIIIIIIIVIVIIITLLPKQF